MTGATLPGSSGRPQGQGLELGPPISSLGSCLSCHPEGATFLGHSGAIIFLGQEGPHLLQLGREEEEEQEAVDDISVGCHAWSRDGAALAVAWSGSPSSYSIHFPDTSSGQHKASSGLVHRVCSQTLSSSCSCIDISHRSESDAFVVAAGCAYGLNITEHDKHGSIRQSRSMFLPHPVVAVALSPCGHWIAAAAMTGVVKLWPADLGGDDDEICAWEDHMPQRVTCMSFDPRSRWLAIACWDGHSVLVTRAERESAQWVLHQPPKQSDWNRRNVETCTSGLENRPGTLVAWCQAAGSTLVCITEGSESNRLCAYDPDSGERLGRNSWEVNGPPIYGLSGFGLSQAFALYDGSWHVTLVNPTRTCAGSAAGDGPKHASPVQAPSVIIARTESGCLKLNAKDAWRVVPEPLRQLAIECEWNAGLDGGPSLCHRLKVPFLPPLVEMVDLDMLRGAVMLALPRLVYVYSDGVWSKICMHEPIAAAVLFCPGPGNEVGLAIALLSGLVSLWLPGSEGWCNVSLFGPLHKSDDSWASEKRESYCNLVRLIDPSGEMGAGLIAVAHPCGSDEMQVWHLDLLPSEGGMSASCSSPKAVRLWSNFRLDVMGSVMTSAGPALVFQRMPSLGAEEVPSPYWVAGVNFQGWVVVHGADWSNPNDFQSILSQAEKLATTACTTSLERGSSTTRSR